MALAGDVIRSSTYGIGSTSRRANSVFSIDGRSDSRQSDLKTAEQR